MKEFNATSELQTTAVDCKNQNEGNLTYKQLLLVPNKDLTNKQKVFLTVHSEMVQAGQKAAECLLIMANNMRRMKDEELYREAGFETFAEYVETTLEIKERQAYTWMSILKLPTEYLEQNAKMGVTKLALIASASDAVAEDLMSDEATSKIKSSKELERIIKAKEKALADKDKVLADKDEKINNLTDELAAERKKIAEMPSVPEVPDNTELEEKIKALTTQLKEANKNLEEAEDKLAEKEENIRELNSREPEVITETVEKTVEIENPETKKALALAQKEAEAAKAAKEKAEQEAKRFQNELAAYKKTQETVSTFKIHAENLFEIWDTVIQAVMQIKAADPDYANKCITKIVAFSDMVNSDIQGVQK